MTPTSQAELTAVAERVALGRERILAEIRKVIVGQDAVIDQVLMALFTGGHADHRRPGTRQDTAHQDVGPR